MHNVIKLIFVFKVKWEILKPLMYHSLIYTILAAER